MIENTQDMRAYHFMKNIDTGDHDLLIRLISPWRYKTILMSWLRSDTKNRQK